jgi:phosphoribosyl-ATP pyrophosphohydrolase/phosphoribosyl-AMP cyclohydrolase
MENFKLKFDENGLIPAIIVDDETREVLMLAYMNAESLKISINEGYTCFWSRSRQELWRKGATSGNKQLIISIRADCDSDALMVNVVIDGPSCHTGEISCFYNNVFTRDCVEISANTKKSLSFNPSILNSIISNRKINPKPGSYTTYLFEKGLDKILKKIG